MSSDLEERVAKIEARNTKVELDKAWEVSLTRRISIAAITYVVVVIYLIIIDNDQPFITAVVPAIGYLLSTLVLSEIRNHWQSKRK